MDRFFKSIVPFVLFHIFLRGDNGVVSKGVTCLDENMQPVDWWFILKLPDGFRYSYYDSNSTSRKLEPYKDRFLNTTFTGSLASTLHQVYENKRGLGYAFYNDEFPTSDSQVSTTYDAHAKGVLAMDNSSGFWLIHSVPKFPDLSAATFRWTASTTFAQSFLCISLEASGLNNAAIQLQHMQPMVFASNLPENVRKAVPQLENVLNGNHLEGQREQNFSAIPTRKQFTHFGKDNDWGKDLYADFVEPALGAPFMWETWRRSPDILPTYCSKNSTYQFDSVNVLSIIIGSDPKYDRWIDR